MTPEQGQHLAMFGAGAIFVIGVVSMLVWRLQERQARRRNAPRFEPRRFALVVEDRSEGVPTVELPPYVCPGCGRNAGHNAKCRGISKRASQIKIPRDGEPQP